MPKQSFSRRSLLQYGLLFGMTTLGGCIPRSQSSTLTAPRGLLPKEWLKSLPWPWKFRNLSSQLGQDFLSTSSLAQIDLMAIGDGWLSSISPNLLKPIKKQDQLSFLDQQAKSFLVNLSTELQDAVYPVGVSPWVMLFRNGDFWLDDAKERWDVLLDSKLKQRIVLPESPRLVMSLAQNISEPNALFRLRRQALTFDDRNAINWLLSGDARVAIVPLQSCFRLLSRDPRLSVIVPKMGAPLNWTLLVSPAASTKSVPYSWIEESFKPPLVSKLLAGGWIPPLSHSRLLDSLTLVSEKYRSILLPPVEVWTRCWSLPPLTASRKERLEDEWRQSTP